MVCNANPNFNSHAHVERDYSGFATGTNYQDFNSHAHVERDVFKDDIPFIYKNDFNSHAHVERDDTRTPNITQANNFNSHAHVERDVRTGYSMKM